MANNLETQAQNVESDSLKFAIPEKGYGVYLKGILPEDQRVLAGAFSMSMQQIRNVNQIQLDKFAQAVYSNENMFGLNLINGTDVPTDVRLARISQDICAVGGGVYGSFTFSNFYGAMSGLPYPLREVYKGIQELETDKLKKIYQELYLAVTWEQADFEVNYDVQSVEVSPGVYDWQYKINSTTMTSPGGGYTRNGAPDPSGDFTDTGTGYYVGSGGATLTTNPDRDVNNVPGTFGRMINLVTTPGNWVTYVSGTSNPDPDDPGIVYDLPAPPIGYLPYPYTGGTNPPYGTAGWPDMNDTINSLVLDADAEILAITTSSAKNFELSNVLNTNWNILGKALKQEQRARYISQSPVPVPRDKWIATYPTSQYVFVDAIPSFASNTLPHMYAQTLEHISDLNFAGGQSVVGLMRESRNDERLKRAGLELDNNLANDMSPQDKEQLIANGTLPGAIGDEGINGYTIPAYTEVTVPVSYYDPCLPGLMCYNETQYIETDPTAAIMSAPKIPPETPIADLPATPFGLEPPPFSAQVLPSGSNVPVPDQSFPCEGARVEPMFGAKPSPVATSLIGTGSAAACDPPVDYPTGINGPPGGPTTSGGKPLIPVELDSQLTASTLIPSTPGGGFAKEVQNAIDKVVACNCDCWVA